MPRPKAGESKESYVSRCIREVKKEGKPQEEAVGRCLGMWHTYSGKSSHPKGKKK